MPVRTTGGVFDEQVLTGSLAHYVVCGADFSGAMNVYGQPVPGSAAEIIFTKISEGAYINIMNPNECNLSFALEAGRSVWDEISLTAMIQALGNDVGVDHVDCSVTTTKRVPYVWGCDTGLADAFAFVASPLQPTLTATGADTLNLIAGTNVSLVLNSLTNSVTINATGGGGSNDYLAVPGGTALSISSKYYVTSAGTVTLPALTGSSVAGTSVTVTKYVGITVFVDVGQPSDMINTDLGVTDSIEMDATQELVFIVRDSNNWDLQVGSTP